MSQSFQRKVVSSDWNVQEILAANSDELHAIARRYSLCSDDAEDAYQRGIEIYLRRAESLEYDGTVGWLKTVIKHEALAINNERSSSLMHTEFEPDLEEARHLPSLEERAVNSEMTTRSLLALTKLKPNERKALKLKAEGYSYAQIGELTGWTYTKVNRCITEGRRRFQFVVEEIESGSECRNWATTISALVDGSVVGRDEHGLRSHMKSCVSCRSSLRSQRRSQHRIVGVVAPGFGLLDLVRDGSWQRSVLASLHEKLLAPMQKLQGAVEAASMAKTTAAVASMAALAGGGLVATKSREIPSKRKPEIAQQAESVVAAVQATSRSRRDDVSNRDRPAMRSPQELDRSRREERHGGEFTLLGRPSSASVKRSIKATNVGHKQLSQGSSKDSSEFGM